MKGPDHAATEAELGALLDASDHAAAATLAIRRYGPQILAYLRAVLRDEDLAADGFSRFGENIWKGIATFRRESSILTWSYAIAWGVIRHIKRDPYQRRGRRLETSEAANLAAAVRESTLPYRKPDAKDAMARLREMLAPDEQTLLILRVDRDLPWKDLAKVFAEEHEAVDEATLRKRFERMRAKLKKLAQAEGLLEDR